jgi:mono/diheme cytochrome c family protein
MKVGNFHLRNLCAAVVLILVISFAGHAQVSHQSGGATRAYYKKTQSDAGKSLYAQNCSKCHMENLKGSCSEEMTQFPKTYVCAADGTAPPLIGASFMERYYSVADLYSRTKWSMPKDNANGLSVADNVKIVTFLLQANGLPSGDQDLKADTEAMKSMALSAYAPALLAAKNSAVDPVNSVGISRAYYTEQQAERGRPYFHAACGVCHPADPSSPHGVNMAPSTGLGWHYGSQHRYTFLSGEAWLTTPSGIPGRPQRWDTVNDLFNKVATAQPAYDPAGLSMEEYLDIMAYLLKQNGFPSGKEPLMFNRNLMRDMTLDVGFESLFNGKDLTGWGFVLGGNCTPRPEGCAQTTPGTTFKVVDGMVEDSGRPHGYMYTLKKYWNFTLRLEYRFDAYKGMETDDDLFSNTGYLLFITKHDVWPSTLEIQGKTDFEMSINPMDGKATSTFDDAARAKARKPAGEWNSVEIVSKDGEVTNYLNGTLISHVSAHSWKDPGYIGIQAESGEVHFRNIRIKSE